ncbi:MAG TPA: aspartate/glutamate racemase family protein, partial [Burkholderiales bacterium]|nr:aspartate/glutamate racemase family protein [Burkholderiales bacterium]
LAPDADEQASLVMAGIHEVKAGALERAREALERAARRLAARGARAIVLACTEVPVALEPGCAPPASLVDATQALAAACVEWALAGARAAPGKTGPA